MDFAGQDDFNNYVVRGFSILGLATVLSGFRYFLWFTTSRKLIFAPTMRKRHSAASSEVLREQTSDLLFNCFPDLWFHVRGHLSITRGKLGCSPFAVV